MNPLLGALTRFGLLGAFLGVVVYIGYKAISETSQEEAAHLNRDARQTSPKRRLGRRPPQPGDNCSICLDEWYAPIEILPCGHVFHRGCLKKWFAMRTMCPVCKDPIRGDDIDEYRKRLSKC